jgi:transposase
MKQHHSIKERNAALIAHVAKGGRPCEIRHMLGMSKAAATCVLRRARKAGKLAPAPDPYSDNARRRDADIRQMLAHGLPLVVIARKLGVSKNTIIGAVDRMRKRGELLSGGNREKIKMRLPRLSAIAEADRLIAEL